MSNDNAVKNGQAFKAVYMYLGKQFGEKVATKIAEKCAKKMGYGAVAQLVSGSIPGKKIADAATSGLKYLYFEAKLNNHQFTPYHPTKYADQYAEFLIYSWARTGKPCYIPDPIIYAAPGSLATHH